MQCHECKHWTGKYHRFGWCKKITELIRSQGIPAHDWITVRRDADADKCPEAKKRVPITLKEL